MINPAYDAIKCTILHLLDLKRSVLGNDMTKILLLYSQKTFDKCFIALSHSDVISLKCNTHCPGKMRQKISICCLLFLNP